MGRYKAEYFRLPPPTSSMAYADIDFSMLRPVGWEFIDNDASLDWGYGGPMDLDMVDYFGVRLMGVLLIDSDDSYEFFLD